MLSATCISRKKATPTARLNSGPRLPWSATRLSATVWTRGSAKFSPSRQSHSDKTFPQVSWDSSLISQMASPSHRSPILISGSSLAGSVAGCLPVRGGRCLHRRLLRHRQGHVRRSRRRSLRHPQISGTQQRGHHSGGQQERHGPQQECHR